MKLAIIGSRNLININIDEEVDKINPSAIVSGGARGIDTLVEDYARRHNLPMIVFKPEYDKYPGKQAPIIRNNQIVAEADFVLAFWEEESRGTMYAVHRAEKLGKVVMIITVEAPGSKKQQKLH